MNFLGLFCLNTRGHVCQHSGRREWKAECLLSINLKWGHMEIALRRRNGRLVMCFQDNWLKFQMCSWCAVVWRKLFYLKMEVQKPVVNNLCVYAQFCSHKSCFSDIKHRVDTCFYMLRWFLQSTSINLLRI